MRWLRGSRSRICWLVSAIAAVGASVIWLHASRPRVLTVCVYTDYSFRQHHSNWVGTLQSRFRDVSGIYENAAGIRWLPVNVELSDPTALLNGLDVRRASLSEKAKCRADLLLVITGIPEAQRTGSVNPFSHSALVVDLPQLSETQNTRILAHELAHLFGSPHERAPTLMAEPPQSSKFSERTARLLRRLRAYDFGSGIGCLQGAWDKLAIDALTQAFTGSFHNPAAHAHRVVAGALENEHRIAPAIVHFREAVKADPESASARFDLAEALAQNLDDEDALKELREGVRLDPRDPRVHGALGMLLAKTRNYNEGFEELKKALELGGGNAPLYSALGSVLLGEPGRLDPAITAFQTAVRLDPNLSPARQGLAKAQRLKKSAEADVAILRTRVQHAPNSAVAHYDLGVAESRLGDFQASAREFEKAIQLNPADGNAHANLALVHYQRGEYRAAWRQVSEAETIGVRLPAAFLDELRRKLPE